MERTLILIKPEGVKRAISGRIISKFEDAGLKIVAMKMVMPNRKLAEIHYPLDKEWYENAWRNTKKGFEAKGLKLNETPLELGKRVRGMLMAHLTSGPVIAFVLEGNDAIASARRLCGSPSPNRADPSTVRGMFSTDSYEAADKAGRTTLSIMHASDSLKTAEREISVWFTKKELLSYRRADDDLIY
ncbi:nucleoside-diphosphate kinase [Candidatus Marsarchaeota archaeon]|jgi:nucleoside-diphosphate kinase|nr:nucleoside-diphosphate kinase [Candidatus Marsarchaeota archaeon]MCL5115451.1 nucleoside-diphosphate kinase [Candidatus Marsarchaeota archaeon]